MAYKKHTWVSKEIIRAEQLNHIEDGIYQEEQRAKNAEEILGERIDEIESEAGAYKVVIDHTQILQPSSKYIYLEPDEQATGNDKFKEWVFVYNETLETYEWKLIGDVSLDLSNYVQYTDYASEYGYGLVQVDGTTITAVDGIISAVSQESGVTSFNGRSGAVTPQSGDYSYSQITGTPTIPGGVKKGTTRAGATDTTLYFVYTT